MKIGIKNIKRTGFLISIVLGLLMSGVYVFSIVGLHSPVTYHINAIESALEYGLDNWTASVYRADMLRVVRLYRNISYVLLGFSLLLKLTSFVLFRIKKTEKYLAVLLLVIGGISIALKVASILAAIPVVAYLGYTDATMQVKFVANALFIIAQIAIIIWTVIFLRSFKQGTQAA